MRTLQSAICNLQFSICNSLRLAAVVLLCIVTAGCSGCSDGIETPYGQRAAPGAASSVNGTAVLAEMFEQAGHQVISRARLTPRVRENADCIVWFPDSFGAPSPDVCEWMEDWLYEQPGRTLVYVGRDFDAAGFYWQKVLPDVPAEQQKEVRRRLAKAQTDFQTARGGVSASTGCDFFTIDGQYRPRKVRSLSGDPRWVEDVDPSKLEIELCGRFTPSDFADVLLESEGDALVTREWWDQGQVIVVTNGSFLLNLPLVNHEHRKLAGQLIEDVGPPGQNVVFLESRWGGPPILDEEPTVKLPTGMEIFHEWPANWILLQLSIVGILFCFWRFPIFGRPLTPRPEGTSDFGKHIQALGELLQQSQDRAYAMTRILHYQQTTRQRKDEG